MDNLKTVKFKKGDKILGKHFPDLGMLKGQEYTVKSCTEFVMTLEECFYEETGEHYLFTPSSYELANKRNYREMNPDYLITISIDGVVSEVPLGDLVTATVLIGNATGKYGYELWKSLNSSFDLEDFICDLEKHIEFVNTQNKAISYFFTPYYEKQRQEQDELKALIEAKLEEVDVLVKQLNNLKN
jgi:hypothetical protein